MTALGVDGEGHVRIALDQRRAGALLDRAWELVTDDRGGVIARAERGFDDAVPAEEHISKLYRLHREEATFRALFQDPGLDAHLIESIGPDVDLFLSQIVFKVPGVLGQPWHQDSSIFPFEPPSPIVGVWCALTPARDPSSRLGLAAGSHLLGPLAHGQDASHPTGGRYVALVDQAVTTGEWISLDPGEAVVFDSRLVHATSDNHSDATRVAATAHFAAAGTVDRTKEALGANPFNDWMPWLREAVLVHPFRPAED